MEWDALIVGGGIAGLQAAIQLGRGQHQVLVMDAGSGRSTLCRGYHNVLGWPDGVSGEELRRLGREHAGRYGVRFVTEEAVRAVKLDGGFRITCRSGSSYEGAVLLVATGVKDRYPDLPGLEACMGKSIYVCPDCDSYEIRGKRTLVLGSGKTGASMAEVLRRSAGSLVYVNHGKEPVPEEALESLQKGGIPVHAQAIREVLTEGDGQLRGVILEDGAKVEAEKAFIAFGGNEVRTELLQQLGVERLENKHALADPRTKETSVPGVWLAGDIGVHSEQVVIAMGDGQQAAIWMHKALLAREKMKAREPVGAGT
ncbi:NAD(P)/FAD-dependent oxidoreductase [Gorillibacterium sp. sgz5001074]|uniref:NAD(P)/FAD-dependent oxidoreductase n=1 Tax=Gorillibacterium sp. sgz5001074 TaxID=3446695 RepID=UPI003F66B154